MSTGREQARAQCHTNAWAVMVGDQWFGGFGGRPPGPLIVKLRTHLADALLCVSPQKADDYIERLSVRGHEGGRIVQITLSKPEGRAS